MNAPLFHAPKTWFRSSSLTRFSLLLRALLKAVLEPEAPQEPSCSKRYTELSQQLLRTTRLFWLFSAGLFVSMLVTALLWR
jgi:hypothetical protein